MNEAAGFLTCVWWRSSVAAYSARAAIPYPRRVGFLHSGTADTYKAEADSLRAGLIKTGYIEKQKARYRTT
jgi:hypothetical protein